MDELEKIELLKPELKNLDILLDFSCSDDEEVRLRSFEKLYHLGNDEKVFERFISGLKDDDELVKIECLEALGELNSCAYKNNISDLLNDESWLVCGTAAMTLANLGVLSTIDQILAKLIICDNSEESIRYYFALYRLGKSEYYIKLLEELNNDNYRVRCAVINILICSKPEDSKKILQLFKSKLKQETLGAVISSLKNAIEVLE